MEYSKEMLTKMALNIIYGMGSPESTLLSAEQKLELEQIIIKLWCDLDVSSGRTIVNYEEN